MFMYMNLLNIVLPLPVHSNAVPGCAGGERAGRQLCGRPTRPGPRHWGQQQHLLQVTTYWARSNKDMPLPDRLILTADRERERERNCLPSHGTRLPSQVNLT